MNYKQLAKLNALCFGDDDELSSEQAMLEFDTTPHHGSFIEMEKGKILGYVLHYITCEDTITIYRRGVSQAARGLGLGMKLTTRVISYGLHEGYPFWTYAHKTNLASINSSIKCGCKVLKIRGQWVELHKPIK